MILAILAQRVEQHLRDAELFARMQQRDEAALSQLYDRYSRLLYSTIIKIVTGTEEAEDILQEVFLHAWEKAETFSPERGTAYSWLVTMTRNKAIDRLRSKGYKKQTLQVALEPAEAMVGSAEHDPHDALISSDNRTAILGALKKLSASQQKILELSYYFGYSQSEIAKMLKLPLGTVKTRMRQAVISLRELVREEVAA